MSHNSLRVGASSFAPAFPPSATLPDEVAVRFTEVGVTRGGSGGSGVRVLDGLTVDVPRGGSTMIIGPNGAGKTTLLLALLGEIPFRGRIEMGPGRLGERPRIGYVPQKVEMDRGLPLTVLEFLALGLQRKPLWLGVGAAVRAKAMVLLEKVQAGGLAGRRLGALSGGELQRVLLALALEREPDLLILDEPSAGVDLQGDHLFCEVLEELRAELGFTQIMVSHDLGMVAHHATLVLCVKGRLIAAGSPGEVFRAEVLTELFGMHMGVLAPLPGNGKK